jgi:inosine-uridine nucleoside N-ribohydrolase
MAIKGSALTLLLWVYSNFHADPEAAHIVMHASSKLTQSKALATPVLSLVTWETTVEHSLGWDFFTSILEEGKQQSCMYAAFLGHYVKAAMELVSKSGSNEAPKNAMEMHRKNAAG